MRIVQGSGVPQGRPLTLHSLQIRDFKEILLSIVLFILKYARKKTPEGSNSRQLIKILLSFFLQALADFSEKKTLELAKIRKHYMLLAFSVACTEWWI